MTAAIVEEESELEEAIHPRPGTSGRYAVMAAGALVVVILASVAMERGASSLGTHFAVPDIIVGDLVLAAVTSLPNAVSAIYLARRAWPAAFSTALNSNSLNVTVGLLLPATLIGLAKPSGSGLLVAGWYVGLTAPTLVLAYGGHGLRRASGGIIIAAYALFVLLLIVTS